MNTEVQVQEEDNNIREKYIENEFQAQIEQFQSASTSIQQQKINIHSKLSEALLIHDQVKKNYFLCKMKT